LLAGLLVVKEGAMLWFGRRGIASEFVIGRQPAAGRNINTRCKNIHKIRRLIMRKKLAILALALAFSFLPAADALAKPYYCVQAYLKCIEDCGNTPLFSDACKVGCTIGYWQCG